MTDVRMTDAAAAAVNNRFDDLAAELGNSCTVVARTAAQMEAGAGELADAIADASATFTISWREAFTVCSTAAAIIAGNTNQLSVDLARLDRDASTTITL